jgi:hypothetical protein
MQQLAWIHVAALLFKGDKSSATDERKVRLEHALSSPRVLCQMFYVMTPSKPSREIHSILLAMAICDCNCLVSTVLKLQVKETCIR